MKKGWEEVDAEGSAACGVKHSRGPREGVEAESAPEEAAVRKVPLWWRWRDVSHGPRKAPFHPRATPQRDHVLAPA